MKFSIDQLSNTNSLTHQLVESLRKQIKDGNLEPGTKLPASKDIEQQAGVSRGVVREAIAALKAEGLIISRQGVGVFVVKAPVAVGFEIEPSEFSSIEDAVHILELRMSVEVEAAARAAEERTNEQMLVIRGCLEKLDRQIAARQDSTKADFAFHLSITEATGNPYFGRFIKYVGSGVIPAREIIIKYEDTIASPENYLAIIQQEHHDITQAIADQDVNAAREAMRAHLGNSRDRHIKIVNGYRN